MSPAHPYQLNSAWTGDARGPRRWSRQRLRDHTSAGRRHRLPGWARWLLQAPARLYDYRPEWLLGQRFLRLTHRGRRSGRCRRTVLEVVGFTQQGAPVVLAARGRQAQWYRNLRHDPAVEIDIAGERRRVRARDLDEQEAVGVLADYEHRHRWARPVVQRVFSRLAGCRYDGGDAARRQLVRHHPLVAFAADGADHGAG
jgi:deazaflavin-dependent oxidoreductase (nitroreductase family)